MAESRRDARTVAVISGGTIPDRGLFGVYLTFRIGRETILIDWSFLHRLVPRRWRDRLQDEMPEPEVEA